MVGGCLGGTVVWTSACSSTRSPNNGAWGPRCLGGTVPGVGRCLRWHGDDGIKRKSCVEGKAKRESMEVVVTVETHE